jgi:hypothetical protein
MCTKLRIPWNYIQLSSVEARNEVGLLFILDNPLKLEKEPEHQLEYGIMRA